MAEEGKVFNIDYYRNRRGEKAKHLPSFEEAMRMADESVMPSDVDTYGITRGDNGISLIWFDEPQIACFISNLSPDQALRLALELERKGYKKSGKYHSLF